MVIGICNLTVVPLRATASHRSEMTNQLFFGELFQLLEDDSEWAFIRTFSPHYEGWLQKGQFHIVEDWEHSFDENQFLVVDIEGAKAISEHASVALLPTSRFLPHFVQHGGFENFRYRIEGKLRLPTTDDFSTEFPKLIDYYLHSPYLWGGRSIYGVDCSGLSQAILAYFGHIIQRDAYEQAEYGKTVDFLSETKMGDLAFFDNPEGKIIHVGIMIDNETILHASTKVRIDKIDSEGIYNNEWKRYTHKLRIIKRFL
ncbi:NlpC/P60 family protein [Sphingobacterium sp. LRF_L2]|uniref:C40 family peptidase n=1 Tax=Sphingobacterium sp. LRF_L2 TaxID=3369421 RepID=UPI003F61E2C9